ncbi:cupin domain-containing protein [Luteipulveratus flavus]|uniref:Cupin domain-containing protein n=1 Tax=Luteipulveratus flavus TaxID=3031728 RepID=A0ABT6CB37_9MICO|nr:cupin domain-containing protein [Luteipulveratus sp. YIM 133296]MDF8266101.1 cupin domain-containing protein [Luteipulveratus sp. YIM 133296]
MTDEIRLSDHGHLEITSSDADCLAVLATYEPGEGKPPAHFHPQQEERFEVLTGMLRVETDGTTTDHAAGESFTIPAGTVHRMWNGGTVTTTARWETRPALRSEEWFRGLDRLARDASALGKARPDALGFAAHAARHRDEFRLVVPGPRPLGDVVVRALGAVARLIRR